MNKKLREDYCGLLGCRPQWLQRFASIQCFTFFASVIIAVQGIYLGYIIGIITTLEKRFMLPSTSSGALLSAYDVGHALSVLIVGHYGFWFHKPKWVGIGSFMSSLGCFGLAMPQIIFGAFGDDKIINSGQDGSSLHQASLCLANSSQNSPSSMSVSPLYSNGTTPSVLLENSSNQIAYIILIIFQLVCGISSSPFTTLAYVYIDDNATKKQSPFYLGIMSAMWAFGPAMGFGLAAVCTQTFVTLGSPPPGLTSVSPNWIGAWWLGLIVLSVLYLISGIPFLFFPRNLKRTRAFSLTPSFDNQKSVELLALRDLTNASDYVEEKKDAKWCLCYFARIPLEIFYLIKNPMFVTLSTSWILWSYIVGGYSTFLPKYLEAEFYQPSHKANVYGGLVAVLGVATATAIGGKILSYLNLKPFKALILVVLTGLACGVNFLLLILIQCPNEPINGLTLEQLQVSISNTTSPPCTSNCTCNPLDFSPVCSNERVFYSPCYAGCAVANITDQSFMYESCACTDNNVANAGYCPDPCGAKMVLYLCMTFLSGFVGALFQMAQFTSLIWAVPVTKKTIALALSNFFISVLGFMPSQVIYGTIIDTTCSIWSNNDSSKPAYCLIYNNVTLRVRYHLTTAMFQFLSMLFVGFACYVAKNFDFHMDEEDEEKKDAGKIQK